jgi:putative tryptophan/tyrosine transport system substrate-binding protein
VAVFVGNGIAVDAAKAVVSDIPIVFVIAEDPVQRGLVTSMSRPGSNLTGITFFCSGQLGA